MQIVIPKDITYKYVQGLLSFALIFTLSLINTILPLAAQVSFLISEKSI